MPSTLTLSAFKGEGVLDDFLKKGYPIGSPLQPNVRILATE